MVVVTKIAKGSAIIYGDGKAEETMDPMPCAVFVLESVPTDKCCRIMHNEA